MDTLANVTRGEDGFVHLTYKYSKLYKRASYLTSEQIILDKVYEYDLKAANISSLRWTGKYREEDLTYLAEVLKDSREVAVGKAVKNAKGVYADIKRGITNARHQLFQANGLQDKDIVSIKNDAVFVRGKRLSHTTFGPMEFRLKNTYSAVLVADRIEYYYDRRHDRVDVKGVADSVVSHPDHQEGMLVFFRKVMKYLVLGRKDALQDYLISFTYDYKARKLPKQYYREFSKRNAYVTLYALSEFEFTLEDISERNIKLLNITYNYLRFVLPLIRLLL